MVKQRVGSTTISASVETISSCDRIGWSSIRQKEDRRCLRSL